MKSRFSFLCASRELLVQQMWRVDFYLSPLLAISLSAFHSTEGYKIYQSNFTIWRHLLSFISLQTLLSQHTWLSPRPPGPGPMVMILRYAYFFPRFVSCRMKSLKGFPLLTGNIQFIVLCTPCLNPRSGGDSGLFRCQGGVGRQSIQKRGVRQRMAEQRAPGEQSSQHSTSPCSTLFLVRRTSSRGQSTQRVPGCG